ncbi:TRAP transporter small permease [Catenovulum sediminis]|uniref:TRAP transporter small permease protein n=1 Tax=Catenovulum sediminis TaxID=1740262 RepID=A0ABV1RL37_9ALTE|nr:TRAP transporter small permease [Catenovulum sediminis]
MHVLQSLSRSLERLLGYLLILLVASIVAGVSWQVFSRYVLQAPSSVTEELARFLLIWIGLFGAAYAYRTGSHLGLDILTTRLKGSALKVAEVFINLAVLTFAIIVMLIGGISLVALTMDPAQTSASLEVQMGYVYLAVPASGALITLFALSNIVSVFLNSGSGLDTKQSDISQSKVRQSEVSGE